MGLIIPSMPFPKRRTQHFFSCKNAESFIEYDGVDQPIRSLRVSKVSRNNVWRRKSRDRESRVSGGSTHMCLVLIVIVFKVNSV